MKKIINVFLAAALVFPLSGCWKLDYLPQDSLSEGSIFEFASDITKIETGVYGQMKRNWCFGYDFLFDSVTDIGIGDYFQSYHTGQYSYSGDWIKNCWQMTFNLGNYASNGIRTLEALDAVDPASPDAEGKVTTTVRDQTIAEFKFLRALAYFRLINLFGDVPYYDESWDTASTFMDRFVVPSTVAEVREKILADLQYAIDKLPDEWPEAQYGRATRTAAYALRGKVKLYAKDYAGAINDFEWVVSNGRSGSTKVALDPSYRNVFRVFGTGKRSPEMIFSIQNSNTAGMATTTLMGNKASLRQIPTDRMNPSTELIEMYEKKDGTPFNWDEYLPGWNAATPAQRRAMVSVSINVKNGVAYVDDLLTSDTTAMARAYSERDPRLAAVAVTPYSTYLGTNSGSVPQTFHYWLVDAQHTHAAASVGNGTMINFNGAFSPSYFCRKFVIEGAETGGEYNNAPYEWPIIRYADVLLMLAEAYNANNNDSKACSYLNQVRARVGMPAVNLTGTALRDYIRDERARELPFEGHRFFDLRRWGIASQVIPGDAKTIFGEVIYTKEYPAKYDCWPIPSVEIDRTPGFRDYQKQGW